MSIVSHHILQRPVRRSPCRITFVGSVFIAMPRNAAWIDRRCDALQCLDSPGDAGVRRGRRALTSKSSED